MNPAAPAARPALPVVGVSAALAIMALGVVSGVSMRGTAALVVLVTLIALTRPVFLAWPKLIAALIVIILFIPIRRYALPASLPFQLEPYRIFVAFLVLAWCASLLVDPRTRLRRTGLEGPLFAILGTTFLSLAANPGRVAAFSSEIDKKLMFFLSFLLVIYLTTSVIRRLDNIDYLIKTLVGGGAVVAFFAIVEARTGFNIFNHLSRVIPFLNPVNVVEPGGFLRYGAATVRVFGPAQHPIALSAALVMLTPLSLYLARRTRQRRWIGCALLFAAGCASTVSRTGIMMFVVVVVVFIWLRPRETKRMWPAVLPLLVAIHFVLPGTIGSIKHSFFPAGGLLAEQKSQAGESGSGRLADLGPSLHEWAQKPLVGEGFATRVPDSDVRGGGANVLDDQWLGTLLETGIVGAFAWLWLFIRVVRRFGAEAKRDESERGWLLASIAAGVAAYGVGMFTYDAFSFIQVTFLVFIFIGLGSALMAEPATPLAVRGLPPVTPPPRPRAADAYST
jgi:O-antigen ligase